MNDKVKAFIEKNYALLDSDLYEFLFNAFMYLWNEDQAELIKCLESANIDFYTSRNEVLTFIITNALKNLKGRSPLAVFVVRTIGTPLGLTPSAIFDYILNNKHEWEPFLIFEGNVPFVQPSVSN